MKRFINRGILKAALCVCLTVGVIAGVVSTNTQTALAKDPYTYTVIINAGNAGTFTSASTGYVKGGTVALVDSKTIKVTGIKNDERVSFDFAQVGAVTTSGDNAKYVSVGVRQSGHDEMAMPNVQITKDTSYTIAYAIEANTVQYTVKYVDEKGAEVHAPATYRGNVGDTIVVGAQHVENMKPDAWNKGHKLSANESENTITFVYKSTQEAAPGGTNTVYETVELEGETVYVNGGTGTRGAAGTAGTGATGADTAEEAGETAEEAVEEAGGNEEPQEYVNIDEEETPLANTDLEGEDSNAGTKSGPSTTMYAGGIALIIIILAAIALAKKRRG